MSKRFLGPLLTALLLVAGVAGVSAQENAPARFANLSASLAPRHLPEGRPTSAPIGFVRFCAEFPKDCTPDGPLVGIMSLDSRRKAELERVNRNVNDEVEPMTDLEHYGETERWAYPDDGKGDCEDYVLEKRRRLMKLGWPASVLLITVVRDLNGDGHAVLTIVTDKGDLVLDNQEESILSWKETGYRFVKRQAQGNPSEWASLGETRVPPVVVGGGK